MNPASPQRNDEPTQSTVPPDKEKLLPLRIGIAKLSFLLLGTLFFYAIFWFAKFTRQIDRAGHHSSTTSRWTTWMFAVFYPVTAPLVFSRISTLEKRWGLVNPIPLPAVGIVYLPALIALYFFPSKWNGLILCLYLSTFLFVQWRFNRIIDKAAHSMRGGGRQVSPLLLLPLGIFLSLSLAVIVMVPLLRAGVPRDFFELMLPLCLAIYFVKITGQYVWSGVLAGITSWITFHFGISLRHPMHWTYYISNTWHRMTEGRDEGMLALGFFTVLSLLMCAVLWGYRYWKNRSP